MAIALPGKRAGREREKSGTDDRLMAAWARGNRAAFDELYERYKQPLYAYLFRSCRDEPLASELFQDVWLRVISSAGSYRQKGRFRSWIFALAHNRLVDHYRRAEHQAICTRAEDEAAPGGGPSEQAETNERMSRLEEVVGELPMEQRQAFYLREECGFAVKDIAEIQSVTVEAAKSRLRYAYRKLRAALGEGIE